ncbi:MAG: hypothetical protein KGL39_12250 [Patescibacteria group bacterium]|nr:hypothetical protein [Patescibacteria group bacterium]
MLVAEHPEERRKWNGWVILNDDEEFYRVTLDDPATSDPLQRLFALGWQSIPVTIIEK